MAEKIGQMPKYFDKLCLILRQYAKVWQSIRSILKVEKVELVLESMLKIKKLRKKESVLKEWESFKKVDTVCVKKYKKMYYWGIVQKLK
jgi:hypothetical protein